MATERRGISAHSRVVAAIAWALVMLVGIAAAMLATLNGAWSGAAVVALVSIGLSALTLVSAGTVGALVVAHRPGNIVGWLFLGIAGLFAFVGAAKRIELVYHNVDGHILISGHPGRPRSWLANLAANPRFTFHLKQRVPADLAATARVITDTAQRELFLKPIARLWRVDHVLMVRSAPLVEVTFD